MKAELREEGGNGYRETYIVVPGDAVHLRVGDDAASEGHDAALAHVRLCAASLNLADGNRQDCGGSKTLEGCAAIIWFTYINGSRSKISYLRKITTHLKYTGDVSFTQFANSIQLQRSFLVTR